MSLPSTVLAVVQPDPSSPNLELRTLPFPKAGENEYIVKVEGTAPCPGELTWELAFPALYEKATRDRVPGTEGAGTVVQAPAGAKFAKGDRVMWRTDAWLTGAARAYTVVPEANLARKPKSLSWPQAAATPLSTLTAWQGVFEHGTLGAAALSGDAAAKAKNTLQRVLITGASGGVGSWAVKFAAAAGAGAVIAVCSGSKAAEVRKYGATEVVDYRSTSVDKWAAEDASRQVDIIFDCVGGKNLASLWPALKDGGTFLSVTGNPADSKPEGKQVKDAKWFLVTPRGSDLAHIAELIEKNSWKPLIDSVVPFDQFAEAWRKVDAGKANGKVVVTV